METFSALMAIFAGNSPHNILAALKRALGPIAMGNKKFLGGSKISILRVARRTI